MKLQALFEAAFQCMECGKKFSKPVHKCPKCGGVDIDVAPMDEFAADPKGDSGTGLVMPPEKHELMELKLSALIPKR